MPGKTLSQLETLEDLADFIEELPTNDDANALHGFDMSTPNLRVGSSHPCGSACCIEGWKNEAIDAGGLRNIVDPECTDSMQYAWYNLCFELPSYAAWQATPQQGAVALREWLVNGNDATAAWREALDNG